MKTLGAMKQIENMNLKKMNVIESFIGHPYSEFKWSQFAFTYFSLKVN